MPTVSRAVDALPSSGIREILTLAMDPARNVARLEIGEPDFTTPAHIVEAAVAAARRGSSYVQSSGMPDLRDALAARVAGRYGLQPGIEQLVITQGAVQAVAAVMSAVVGPGDEVLIPDPAWPNYEMQATLLGARPVAYGLRVEAGFQPDLAEIEGLISPRTRAIILNSPNNPTGAVMTPDSVRKLVDIAVRHDVLVISDEVYDEMIFEGAPANAAQYAPEHVAAVYSFSKTYAMTGWRVGYAVLPHWLAAPVSRIMETTLSCVSSVTQQAALAAITGPQECVRRMRDAYRSRRDISVGLATHAGLSIVEPGGAFYLMLPLSVGADARLSALELVHAGVSMSPGTAFGAQAPHHLRASLANSEATIRRGMEIFLDWHARTDGGLDLLIPHEGSVGPPASSHRQAS